MLKCIFAIEIRQFFGKVEDFSGRDAIVSYCIKDASGGEILSGEERAEGGEEG